MDLDIHNVALLNAFDQQGEPAGIVAPACLPFDPAQAVVALGEEPHKFLKAREIPHFKLPHPSGLNRKLNDKQEISRLLYRCKKYIYK